MKPRTPPTARQREWLAAIANAYPDTPTYRELLSGFGLTANNSVADALARLERHGLIVVRRSASGRGTKVARIQITPAGWTLLGVELCATCGAPRVHTPMAEAANG